MAFSQVQDHSDDLVGGHVDMDAIFRKGNSDPHWDVPQQIMFGPFRALLLKPLKMKYQGSRSAIQVLAIARLGWLKSLGNRMLSGTCSRSSSLPFPWT